jgi:hypothetical protein
VTEWKRFTWSDVVYPGTEVYNRLVMFDFSGVCGSSEYVAYNTLSVQDGVLRELSGQESVPRWDATRLPPTYICRLRRSRTCTCTIGVRHESCADHDTEEKTWRTDLEIPEITLSQTHEHGTFLLFHPQLVILLQFLPLALAIECGDKSTMIVWST